MIDVHTHVLADVDDGAKSTKETFRLIEEAEREGFTDLILTPHYIAGCYENSKKELESKVNDLQEQIKDYGMKMQLHLGEEIYIAEDVAQMIEEGEIASLANSRYVLIELPIASSIKIFSKVVKELIEIDKVPVIAHPERYMLVQNNPVIIEKFVEIGCLIQCNYGSLVGIYGTTAQKTIKKLLKKDLVHFLGSDCHKEKTIYPYMPLMLKKLKRIVSKDKYYELTTSNPSRILLDRII